MHSLFGNQRFIFVADDWGGGPLVHFCAKYPSDVLLQIPVDPISLDGYPVSEIQAIGRASGIGDETEQDRKMFQMAMSGFDQTVIQIYKTMVYNPNVYNQYKLRDLKDTYIDVDYERRETLKPGEKETDDNLGATSMTMKLNFHNIRVLAERSSRLSPAQLLPYDKDKNPRGVDYLKITAPTLVIWGLQDNMMPALQRFRLQQLMRNAHVHTVGIDRAGHFVATDKPKEVAEAIVSFIIGELGVDKVKQAFLGFKGIWKGDEVQVINKLKHFNSNSVY